jgi:hypothetical protein
MKKLIFILTVTMIFTISCKTNYVMVKIKNQSDEDFKHVEVRIAGKRFTFENLKSKETTKYVKVDKTFPYCPAEVITEKDTLFFRPFDYIGEKLYTSGKLTMKISIVKEENKRSLDINSKRPLL